MKKIVVILSILAICFFACSKREENKGSQVTFIEKYQSIPLNVNYLQLSKITELSNWFKSNSFISDKNFPLPKGKSTWEKATARLFYSGKSMTVAEAISIMDSTGYRPANIFELLAFGQGYSDDLKRVTVIAPEGSIPIGGRVMIPYITILSVGVVSLDYQDTNWQEAYFLGIKK